MSYRTVEVELENCLVRPRKDEQLPARATGLLTILESHPPQEEAVPRARAHGLRRLLSGPDFPLTPQQFAASMEADFWEQ